MDDHLPVSRRRADGAPDQIDQSRNCTFESVRNSGAICGKASSLLLTLPRGRARHVVGQVTILIGPGARQGCHHLALRDRILVLAHLDFADKPRDRQPETHRPQGHWSSPVPVEEHRPIDVAFESIDQPGQHPERLVRIEELRHAVAVNRAEVPRGSSYSSGRIQPGDVVVAALNDQQNLLVTEPMDHLVGPTTSA